MPQAVVAFLAAPFLGLLVAVPLVAAAFGDSSSWGLYFAFGLFLAYPSALFIGIPLYMTIRRLSPTLRLWHALAGGCFSALPLMVAWLYPFSGPYFERAWPINLALAVASGAASGVAFWVLMWKPRSNPSFQRTASGGR